jgi:hypothetical protein
MDVFNTLGTVITNTVGTVGRTVGLVSNENTTQQPGKPLNNTINESGQEHEQTIPTETHGQAISNPTRKLVIPKKTTVPKEILETPTITEEILEKIHYINVSLKLDNAGYNKIDENLIINIIKYSINNNENLQNTEIIRNGKLVITISYNGNNDFRYTVPLSNILKNNGTYRSIYNNIDIYHSSSNNKDTIMSDNHHKILVIKIIDELGKLSADLSTTFISRFTPKKKNITINGKQLDVEIKRTENYSKGGYRKTRKAKKSAKNNKRRKTKTRRT